MKAQYGLLLVCVSVVGCAPMWWRSAYMCPPQCAPRIVSIDNCEPPCEYQPIAPGGMAPYVPPASASTYGGTDPRVSAMENELQSLKSDVGDVQRQNDQLDRKLDKVIDHVTPLK